MRSIILLLTFVLFGSLLRAQGANSGWEKLGPVQFAGLARQGESTVVATTTHGYLYMSNDFGKTWRSKCLDDTMELGSVEFSDSLHGAVLAVSGFGDNTSSA